MDKISVIVPIYNSEKYLNRCLDSIINQTYEHLEIILVNDGSTDLSVQIIEEYAEKDNRIIVINKPNGGQSSARNKGLDIVSGSYVAFVDSDDWLSKDIYEYCLSLAKENDCDVVDFGITFNYGKNNEVNKNENFGFNTNIIEGKEILRNYLLRGQTGKAPFSPCRKLYKQDLFTDVEFPEGKINEDIATNYRILSKSKRLITTDKVGYFYFQDGMSTTRNGFKVNDFDLLDAGFELLELTKHEKYPDLKYLAKVKQARSYFSLLAKIAYYGFDDKTLEREKIVNELRKGLRDNFFLLIKSPMQLNRKLMACLLVIDIKLLEVPLMIFKKIKVVKK